MVTTTSLKVGESLTIGLYFNDNYQLPITCNLIVFIGGVCVGNLFTQEPEIEKVGIYYTIRLSSQDTSKMRGYRDLIVVLDDPERFGNKKFIVGGILFDRMADEFITTSENKGYNMLIGMTVGESIVSGNVELIEAIKGEKGDKGEDAALPDGIVIDENYVHTDNNYTNADKTLLSTALQSESDPVYALDKNRLSNTSGVNTGDQDLSGLVEKVPLHSLVHDIEINKLAEYPQLPETPEGYYLADDGTFKALPDFVTESEMIDYVGSEMGAGSVVIKEYVDQQDALKVDKVAGSSLLPDSERAKLAGIEENANDYTHPETHPSSILDVVDVVGGAANKFLNERGEMVAVATSSIGVTGSQLYASTADSNVAGYKSLVGTPQPLETEILLTAKSPDGIVWGAKYLSAPFTEAVTIPTTAYGFDYWRKVSASNGTSRKHLRVFLYRAGVETNISAPLVSPSIDDTEFTERQISYIFPELVLLAGDRIGIQEGFSTTHANNITFTYIVGDGRGWFMRLPLPLKHENLTDKNSEAAFQHVDTTVELGEAINEGTHSLILWNGIKPLKVLFSRVITFFESYFLKFGGQTFGAKKAIGSNDNQDFAVKTNNVERVVVSKSGTVTVNDTLEVKRSTASVLLRFINGYDSRVVGGIAHDYGGGVSISGGTSVYYSNGISIGIGDEIRVVTNSTRRAVVTKTGDIGIGVTAPKSKLQIDGAIQIADDTAAASADKEGAIRYRKDANNSYIEMCMQTGASTYSWVVIKQNTW